MVIGKAVVGERVQLNPPPPQSTCILPKSFGRCAALCRDPIINIKEGMNINFINSLVSCLVHCWVIPLYTSVVFFLYLQQMREVTFYHSHRRGWSRRNPSPKFQFNIDITGMQQQVEKGRRTRGGGGQSVGNSSTWVLLHFSLGFGSAFRYSFCSYTPWASFFDTRTVSKPLRYLSRT